LGTSNQPRQPQWVRQALLHIDRLRLTAIHSIETCLVEESHIEGYVPVSLAAVIGFVLLQATVNEKILVAWDRWN
jgi:hypothetical protein